MSATRYLFDLEMPPVFLGETVAVVTAKPDVTIAYEETLTWDAGAAVGLIRVETGTLAIIDEAARDRLPVQRGDPRRQSRTRRLHRAQRRSTEDDHRAGTGRDYRAADRGRSTVLSE